jgi:hypothetical protein
MENGWTKIFETDQKMTSLIVMSLLKENNIESVELDKRSSSYAGFGEIELFVKDDDVTIAKIIVDQYKNE